MKLWFQIVIDLLLMLRSPGSFFFGLFELLISWFRSRNWWAILFLLPIGIPVVAIASITIAAYRSDSAELLKNYWGWIDQETSIEPSGILTSSDKSGVANSEESSLMNFEPRNEQSETISDMKLIDESPLTKFADTLIRKSLVLDKSNTRGLYFAAKALEAQGKTEQASQMMRGIAPRNGKGYPPAHAWLAANRLQREGVQERKELDGLLHDLSIACTWNGAGALLMSIYSDLLVREDRVSDAITVLQSAVTEDPTLLIKIAGLAMQSQRTDLFNKIWGDVEEIRQEKIEKGLGSETDFVVVASIMLLNDQADQGIFVAQNGLQSYPSSSQIKRVLSNAFLVKFNAGRQDSTKKTEYKLELLDLAMKADPSNPGVLEKIGELAANQTLTSDQIATIFRQQLANGRATAISHLLLAIGHLREDQLEKALVHLELAQQLAPNNPVVLNNLALALARVRPERLAVAKTYIETAIRVGGAEAEHLDTYGEILSLSGDWMSAIRAFEASLARNPKSINTRKKLAEAYEKVGLNDMAESVGKEE